MDNADTNDFYRDQNLETVCKEVSEETCEILHNMTCLHGVSQADQIQIGLLIGILNNTAPEEPAP